MAPNCPMRRRDVVDRYFMEHRAKLLDVAAFLDRLERAEPDGGSAADAEDFRVAALRRAIAILDDGGGQRAKRILEVFSDPTSDPIAAASMKGANGAYDAGAERGA